METRLLHPEEVSAVAHAVALLAAGELVALPTETVYGLAADAANARAVAAVFQAKDRPFFDPLIVHLPDAGFLERLAVVPREQTERVARLTAAFWPGPLTILLPRRTEAVPDLVTAGSPLVALRVSRHPVFERVIRQLGRPLAAPSANRFGRISPTTGAHALAELRGRIPLVLEAGAAEHGVESTIVALEAGGRLRILRHGPITAERLAEFGETVSGDTAGDVTKSAPGQVEGHYAPRTPLRLIEASHGQAGGEEEGRADVGWLVFRRDRMPPARRAGPVEALSEAGELREAATRLFAALRRLDEAGLTRINAECVPKTGLGRAIMERLERAAAGSRSSPGK